MKVMSKMENIENVESNLAMKQERTRKPAETFYGRESREQSKSKKVNSETQTQFD